MSNNSDQFIAFDIEGADEVTISENVIAGKIDNVLKSKTKIGKLIAEKNTIINSSEASILLELINTLNVEKNIPNEILDEINLIITELNNVKSEREKLNLFSRLASASERIIATGSGVATIIPFLQNLISQLPQ